MFNKSYKYYDALYHFKNYKEACDKLHLLIQKLNPNAKTLLDIACGTGKHLEYLKNFYEVEGLDINQDLLDIAQKRLPSISLHKGDMIEFELGHKFDVATCLFSSIGYVKYIENLYRSISCMEKHLEPGGILILEPWFSPDNYWVDRLTANYVDEPDLKISWMYVSKMIDKLSIMDIHYLVGTPEGISYFEERHEFGLFKHKEYLEAFQRSNLEVSYDSKGLFDRGMYIGVKNS